MTECGAILIGTIAFWGIIFAVAEWRDRRRGKREIHPWNPSGRGSVWTKEEKRRDS